MDEQVDHPCRVEIGDLDRTAAEALRLEIRRLATALGVEITTLRVERAPDEGESASLR